MNISDIVAKILGVYTLGMLKKILGFYTKYCAVWVVLFGVAVYVRPGPFVAVEGYMDWFFAPKYFGEQAAMPAAIFVFICIITAALMAAIWQRRVPD